MGHATSLLSIYPLMSLLASLILLCRLGLSFSSIPSISNLIPDIPPVHLGCKITKFQSLHMARQIAVDYWFFRKAASAKLEAYLTKRIKGRLWPNILSTWTLLLNINFSSPILNLNQRGFEAANVNILKSSQIFWVGYLVLEAIISQPGDDK